MFADNWVAEENLQPTGEISLAEWFTESSVMNEWYGHGCSRYDSENGTVRCYYRYLELAKWQCKRWTSCRYIYQTDTLFPNGGVLYWPRGDGYSVRELGSVLWKMEGTLHCKCI